MNPDFERRVQSGFEELVDHGREERAERLAAWAEKDPELAARVAALLARHDAGSPFLARPRVEAQLELEESAYREIGPFRIEGRLGRGGTSSVFVGRRADGRRAAVKVLRFGLDSAELRRRFAVEKEVLAGLEHPSIAALLAAGATPDGLPWLATELIDGLPVTEDCDRRRLTVRERLEVFLAICDAVHHAHTRLVVHRDLKPANVLVDLEGRPKVLDFGIAKLMEGVPGDTTEDSERILTVNYASPEHLAGRRVTTASDVFSLGVLLCELLCGRRPWDWTGMASGEVLRALELSPPARPSRLVHGAAGEAVAAARGLGLAALRRRLRGDLDAIVERALRVEVEARYGSVLELAADVRRALQGEPVLAVPRSNAYRLGRLLRRHAVATTAAAAAFVAVAVFGAVSYRQLLEVRRGRSEAESARREAEEVTRALLDSFEVASAPAAVGGMTAARRILESGERRALSLAGSPGRRASLEHALGVGYLRLGLFDDAERMLESALALRRAHLPPADPATLETLLASADLLRQVDRLDEAERRAREALAGREATLGRNAPATAGARRELARIVYYSGRAASALAILEPAMALHRSAGDVAEQVEDLALHAQIHTMAGLGRPELAETSLREALELERARGEAESRTAAGLLQALGVTLTEQGRLGEAEPPLGQAIAILERILGPEHPDVASLHLSLGILLDRRGDYAAALREAEHALAIRRAAFGGESRDVAHALNSVALCRFHLGRVEEAEAGWREALRVRRRLLPPGHEAIAESLNNLALALNQSGRWAEAEALRREALELWRAELGPDHPMVAVGLHNLSAVVANRDAAEAEALAREALAVCRRVTPPPHARCAYVVNHLAALRRRAGDLQAAEAFAREGLTGRLATAGEASPETADSRTQLAAVLVLRGELDEARREVDRAIETYRGGAVPDDHWRVGLAHLVRGLARVASGEAEGLAEAVAGEATIRSASPPGSALRADAAHQLAMARRRSAAASRP